jgi:glycosyltransferase involved in cell wall biosynthesis
MPSPRLWVVSELYYPEETSTGYFLTKISEGLADTYDVHAICSRPTYSERDLSVPWRERHGGVEIHRMRSTRLSKDSVAGRILNLLSFTILAGLFCLLRFRRGDRVLVVTNPPTIPPLVGLLARFKRVRAYLLIHDVYPEVLIATGLIRPEGLPSRLLGKLTTATYRLYYRIIVLGRDMEVVARKRLGMDAARVTIIPNWGDVDWVQPMDADRNPFTAAYNPDRRMVVQFSGNIGRTHDIESVLAAAEVLKDRSNIQFQFVGSGGKVGLVGSASSANIAHLPRQPREMLGPMLASADAVVISFVDGMLGVSVPSRMYNVMAAGTPIIAMAHPDSELAQVVREEACGWVVPPGDVAALVAIVEHLATSEGQSEARA